MSRYKHIYDTLKSAMSGLVSVESRTEITDVFEEKPFNCQVELLGDETIDIRDEGNDYYDVNGKTEFVILYCLKVKSNERENLRDNAYDIAERMKYEIENIETSNTLVTVAGIGRQLRIEGVQVGNLTFPVPNSSNMSNIILEGNVYYQI